MTPLHWKLAGAAAVLLLLAAALAWGLYWRGEYRELKAAAVVLEDQATVLGSSLKACNASALDARRAADAAIASGQALLAEARRLHAGSRAQVARLEDLLKRPTPAGAGCEDAWSVIESAGGAP